MIGDKLFENFRGVADMNMAGDLRSIVVDIP
jgi:hypothetical protein